MVDTNDIDEVCSTSSLETSVSTITDTDPRMFSPSAEDIARETIPTIKHINKHLACFNCLPPTDEDSGDQDQISAYATLCTGVTKFQKLLGFPETGIFDSETAKRFNRSHCHHRGRGGYKLDISADRTDVTYCFDRYSDQLSVIEIRAIFDKAFKQWERQCPLPYTFTEAAPHKRADIRIQWSNSKQSVQAYGDDFDLETPFDEQGTNGPVHVFCPAAMKNWKTTPEISINFNEDEKWTDTSLRRAVLHHIGHILGLGHSETEESIMWPAYINNTLHETDIKAIRDKYRYRHKHGVWTQILDKNLHRVAQIVAVPGGTVYRRDRSGSIWRYKPSGSWEQLDNSTDTVQIDASSHHLDKLNKDGEIWRHDWDQEKWRRIDWGSNPVKVIRSARDGKEVYQHHSQNGQVWVFTGGDDGVSWKWMDGNSNTVDIAANASQVFLQWKSGSIFLFEGVIGHWAKIQGPCDNVQMVGAGESLYRLDGSGEVFEWRGVNEQVSCRWGAVDDNPDNVEIAAAESHLYVRRRTGEVWYTNRRGKNVGSLADWVHLETSHKIVQLSAAGDGVYGLDEDGGIHQIFLE
ncbi:hypothetical protein TWF281_005776 [Arthrobotrys megalospora]